MFILVRKQTRISDLLPFVFPFIHFIVWAKGDFSPSDTCMITQETLLREITLCASCPNQGWACLKVLSLIFSHYSSNSSSFPVQIFLKTLIPWVVIFCNISFGDLWIHLLETPSIGFISLMSLRRTLPLAYFVVVHLFISSKLLVQQTVS